MVQYQSITNSIPLLYPSSFQATMDWYWKMVMVRVPVAMGWQWEAVLV